MNTDDQPRLGPGPGADEGTLKLFKAFVRDGRIEVFPAKWSRRLVLLERVAQLFEPGVRYDETRVNRILRGVHDDYVALRRYLVEAQLLGRENGEYWRIGGTVDR